MSVDLQTLDIYKDATKNLEWINRSDEIKEYSQFIDEFLDLLPPSAKIFDMGCGPGHFAAEFLARGYEVEASDAVAEVVEIARKKHGVNARVETFDALDQSQEYDGVWASFSLLHAPKFIFPGVLQRVHKALKPKGALHLGMKLGEGEHRDELGRLFSYYSEEELMEVLIKARFEVVGYQTFTSAGLSKRPAKSIAILAHA